MNKKLLVGIVAIAIILTGCIPKQENAFKEVDIVKIGEDVKEKINEKFGEQEQLKILKDYYESIENNISEDQIINSIKDNITKLDENKADEMLIQFENFLYSKGYDAKKVTEKLTPFVENGSDEFKSYFEIWETETENETTDGEGLKISAEEIIDRALNIERFTNRFPDSKLKQKLEDLYKAYIGLSLKGLGNPYIFAKEGETTLNPDLLEMYKQKINNNPDSRTAKILNLYIVELEKDSYNLNGDNVNYFYENIDGIIDGTN
ncbi:MAG: hypothetical protein RBR71_07285 [Gudongella sp.]|nr:hypothetical protein [Gudongella sp.]